ncbi:MAG: tetratricopeptide repeat protein [Chloroflexi bacterium]|nr:MAG: tetratricopeptide repeat protein [Chloroflexota bacterium]
MAQSSTAAGREANLLERSAELAALAEQLEAVTSRAGGRLAFVAGEAGVGKTALVRRFAATLPATVQLMSGACDALVTPRPLAPFLDVAALTGGELEELALARTGAKPHEFAAGLMRELRQRAPSVIVLEDLHWADAATLDVLRIVARRVESVDSLIIATFRDDELDRMHPLRMLLGGLAGAGAVTRIKLAALSEAAVAQLAEPYGVDATELYRLTSGNAFYVTEVLAGGTHAVPATVQDAVLARTARLSSAGRTLVEAASIVPAAAELWLLAKMCPEAVGSLDECVASGVLSAQADGVAFRHELARMAVEASLPLNRKSALHSAAMSALADPPQGDRDPARLAHHAEGAGDTRSIRAGDPRRQACVAGNAGGAFSGRAHACYLCGQFNEALDAQLAALDHYRTLDDRRRAGDSLWSLSRLYRYVGRPAESLETAQEAITILEQLPAGAELAMAYCNLSHIYVNADDVEDARVWGHRALELAQKLGHLEAQVYAEINLAVVDYLTTGSPGTAAELERIQRVAQENGLDEHAGRVLVALTWWSPRFKSYELADRYYEEGLEFSNDRGLDLWRHYMLAYRARCELDRGRWDEATRLAEMVIRDPLSPVPRIVALVVLGLVRARRGDPGFWPPLDEAAELAAPSNELQRREPVATARAEALWLEGREGAIPDATAPTFEIALHRRANWVIGEMACWRLRAGIGEPPPDPVPEPYALELEGRRREASEAWLRLGCPYEAAISLAWSTEEADLRQALSEFQRLGARPAAAIVSRRLRRQGVRGLPRGPRATTLRNRANLTEREMEILELVANGHTNAQIAERVFLSTKTVDHHVSAILSKLGVKTRGQAAAQIR